MYDDIIKLATKQQMQQQLQELNIDDNIIERSFAVFEKNYGENYDLEVLKEIARRLEAKDANKKQQQNDEEDDDEEEEEEDKEEDKQQDEPDHLKLNVVGDGMSHISFHSSITNHAPLSLIKH